MQITLLPQRKLIEIEGRRSVGEVLKALGLLPGTVMVIRGDELVTEQEMVEADDALEIRNVISGG
jgi:sulfur carrier protein